MEEFSGKIDGDLVVDERLELRGLVAGNAIVVDGGHLELTGMVSGNLVVNEGGRASVDGTVVGNVLNEGHIEVRGMIHGLLFDAADTAVVHSGAVINGRTKP